MGELLNKLLQLVREYFVALVLKWIVLVRWVGEAMFAGVLNTFQAVMPSANWEAYRTYFEYANYWFPVSETLGYCMLLFTLWVVVFAYRLVKSWVPTASN